jgi:putative ABC transport system substrate-binding protein
MAGRLLAAWAALPRRFAVLALAGLPWLSPAPVPAQPAELPVVGVLNGQSPETVALLMKAFHEGLAEAGYVADRNVTVEYRWANVEYGLLPELAAELVEREVAVIFAAGSGQAILAAKSATTTIPVVFATGGDPVRFGYVSTLSRPGGNLTGAAMFSSRLEPKRLELLHALLPSVETVAVIANPASDAFPVQSADLEAAAQALGLELRMFTARSEGEIDAAFAAIEAERLGALLVASDAFFAQSQSQRIVELAARYEIPTVYASRDFPTVGGLMSYGTSLERVYRQAGFYTGQVLNGEDPADLPVVGPETFDLVVNLRTASALGVTVPPGVMLAATEILN